jgi:hypothetical protein
MGPVELYLVPADKMRVSLLLIGQGIEMLLDLQSDNGGRRIGQVVL